MGEGERERERERERVRERVRERGYKSWRRSREVKERGTSIIEQAVIIIIAISTGYYGTSGGVNAPCLVYSTFSNRIFIYHNIKLPSIASTNLITAMQDKVSFLIFLYSWKYWCLSLNRYQLM